MTATKTQGAALSDADIDAIREVHWGSHRAFARAVIAADRRLAAEGGADDMLWCETCDGGGTIDETLGGYAFSNPKADCPDCDGKGWWRRAALTTQPQAEPAPFDELEFLQATLKTMGTYGPKEARTILRKRMLTLMGADVSTLADPAQPQAEPQTPTPAKGQCAVCGEFRPIAASRALQLLDDVEAMLGGANGPTIQIRSALSAQPQAAEPVGQIVACHPAPPAHDVEWLNGFRPKAGALLYTHASSTEQQPQPADARIYWHAHQGWQVEWLTPAPDGGQNNYYRRIDVKVCRDDGRCQYAIDHGAEGMGHCPKDKCAMPDLATPTAPTEPTA